MTNFAIICDSTCDLDPILLDRFQVDEIINYSLTYKDGNDMVCYSYFKNLSIDEFYKNMVGPGIYKTGAPSPEKIGEVFEKYLKEGKDVVYISMSSGMSSVYNYSLAAKEELLKKYPDKHIICIDSMSYSQAELHLIIRALELRKNDEPIENIESILLEFRNHIHQTGPMDDLFYLAKCGRLSNAKAFLGTIIGVNPIGEINDKGLPEVLVKVKGSNKALKVSTEYIKQTIIHPDKQIIIISNTNRKEKALKFKELIEKEIHPLEVIVCDCGPTCATNIGPGLCGAFYYGKNRSENLVDERNLFEKISKEMK